MKEGGEGSQKWWRYKRNKKAKKISVQKKSVKNLVQKKTNKRKVVNISDDETQQNVDKTQQNLDEIQENVEEENSKPPDKESQDKPCASPYYEIYPIAKTKRTLNWIACGNCKDWWHTFCVDLSSNKKQKFVCPKCCWWTIVVFLILIYISLITLVLILIDHLLLVLLYTIGRSFLHKLLLPYRWRIIDISLY